MATKVKILIVEHDPNDIELLLYELKKNGVDYESAIVQNEQGYRNALINFIPDIILSDYSLPSFDGSEAFKIREEVAAGTPFIFVSGSIGEEISIEYIKKGVTDYVLKDTLFTLSTKVKRALKESKENQQKNKTEQELAQSEKRLARAQQLAHMGSWEIDMTNNTQTWSDGMYEIYGIDCKEQPSTELFLSFIHKEDIALSMDHVARSNSDLTDGAFNFRFTRKDGEERYAYAEYRLDFDEDKRPVRLYGIVQDVSEKKRAEKQQEFDSINLNALINNTTDLMWSVDKDFNLITSNKPFEEITRLMSGKAIAKGDNLFSAGFAAGQLKRFRTFYERAFLGETFTEIEFTDVPVALWSEISYHPIFKGDKVIGAACFSRDITQRKFAELERNKISNDLIQRNKELEQFAYIISHNLRAPVANIIGLAHTVQSGRLGLETEKQMMGHLVTSVKKLDEVIKDLNYILQVKSDVSEQKTTVHFSELMANIQLSIGSLIQKEDVHFISNFTEVEEMETLKSYLHSIFFNLISNSIKYRSANITPLIEITSKKAGKSTILIFKDNGLGIDLEKRGQQVFGLYKRFHAHTEGKGMGLYMVKAQVETLGGTISVSSEVNKGTEFRIEFDHLII